METEKGHLQEPCYDGRAQKGSPKGVWYEEGALQRMYDMITEGELRQHMTPVIVWEEAICKYAEEPMQEFMDITQEICLSSKNLKADERAVEILMETLPDGTDLLIAAGSGTIQELCRYIAGTWKIPYVSIPTEESDRAYEKDYALMCMKDGEQKVPAPGPIYVFGDEGLFAVAKAQKERF